MGELSELSEASLGLSPVATVLCLQRIPPIVVRRTLVCGYRLLVGSSHRSPCYLWAPHRSPCYLWAPHTGAHTPRQEYSLNKYISISSRHALTKTKEYRHALTTRPARSTLSPLVLLRLLRVASSSQESRRVLLVRRRHHSSLATKVPGLGASMYKDMSQQPSGLQVV